VTATRETSSQVVICVLYRLRDKLKGMEEAEKKRVFKGEL